ncbi:AI-2E family transporter [Maritalea sp. S77]|jgi:predicted PurR-regulated permease PerM|uniref:AI-2E family transporter n=1 Tax=Maritalea sp. S77 TaxID=3415125 RepID=UPI003C7B63EC
MTLQNQIKTWLVILGVTILFLWVFRGILLPFIAGMVLAYMLDPAADFLERMKFSRLWATFVIMLFCVLIFIVAFLFLVPSILGQLLGLAKNLPGYVESLQDLASEYTPALREYLGEERIVEIENNISNILGQAVGFAVEVLTRVMQSGLAILNVVGLLIVTPVVAFYLLLDWDNMIKRGDELLPRAYRSEIREVFKEINEAMAGFVRGQSSVVLILAAFYATGLTLVGLNFGLAIGLAAGLFSFVPYVGFLIGFVLSIGVAIVQFWPDWTMIALVFGIFMFGQFIEGNILYPKLVGRSIGVHAVWLMFALFAFALLFGAVGVLLAVPLAAVTGVLVRYAVRKYMESSLYQAKTEREMDVAKEEITSEPKTAEKQA